MEPLGYKSSLVTSNGSVGVPLNLKYPFTPNNILCVVWRDKSPSGIKPHNSGSIKDKIMERLHGNKEKITQKYSH